MSHTSTGFQPIKSTKSQRGQTRSEPVYETYSDLSVSNWCVFHAMADTIPC